ncbi:hypothetical protein SAY87_031404 [Trapa incisa]|uniref:F-box domain-containing protein n=1 Tax=Trapa incisa TaxID=236973 RepID=A0AAN7KXH6_9MYRT|nr:hypothetical protein SAY87_031404 [Trapa incisa]
MAASCLVGIVCSLPDDILTEILARLSMKSILRAKSVCKHWHKLISGEYFSRRNVQVSARNSMAMIEVSGTSLRLLDSLGGVSRLSLDFLETEVSEKGSGSTTVCNPITRQHTKLPGIDVDADLVGLAYDSSGRTLNAVLAGHANDGNDETEGTIVGWVFDSESNNWRKLIYQLDGLYEFSFISKNPAVFVNGAFHWITDGSPTILLVLDLSRDLWRKMTLPDKILQGPEDRVFYLLEFEGCLSVIQLSDSWMVTWVLENYDEKVWYMLDPVSLSSKRLLTLGTSMLEMAPVSQTREDLILGIGLWMFDYQKNNEVWQLMYKMNKYGLTDPQCYSAFPFRATMLPCCQVDDQLH